MNAARSWTGLVVVPCALVALAAAQTTTRVSLSSGGGQANFDCGAPAISANGRFVAFASVDELVPGDTNACFDIFVHDRELLTTERVSVSSTGVEADAFSLFPSLSADGRFVSFQSYATNLVAGDTNGTYDIYVHDRLLGTTELVSTSLGGTTGNSDSSGASSLSADGRWIVFESRASDLVALDTNGAIDVFLRDLELGTTELVSVSSAGVQSSHDSYATAYALSADARFVSFYSRAGNLVGGDTNFKSDIFLRDRLLGTTERVSFGVSGAQGDDDSDYPALSADGRFVAFHSWSTNLVAGDTNGLVDIFVRDLQLGANELVSVSTAGEQGNGIYPTLSADGRYVAFVSDAANLVSADANGFADGFVRDLQLGVTERVSVGSAAEEGNAPCRYPAISGDGRYVAFLSGATNLVSGDTNGANDDFVRDRLGAASAAYCLGDGSGAVCPCANSGSIGQGCSNSMGQGAMLSASGNASVSADTLVLSAVGMPNAATLYLQGSAQENAGTGSVFGDGLRCVAGSVVRLATKNNSGGASSYPGPGDAAISISGAIPVGGGMRYYQVWYRNAATHCTPAAFNLSNGVRTSWAP
jgi:Tol biopolymer transport system component